MISDSVVKQIEEKYHNLSLYLNERSRRLWAATEARALGYGGILAVHRATGISQNTIRAGLKELEREAEDLPPKERIRQVGGGRKRVEEHTPSILEALDRLVEPTSRGEPESPLRWTCKSVNHLADALQQQGYQISAMTVYTLLIEMGYSLQNNRKTQEGKQHPDRDAQFHHIAQQVEAFQGRHRPVISIDTKKKENLGQFKNGGQEWQPEGEPIAVKTHDFPSQSEGKAIPYGIYDLTQNQGWVNVGIDHDTAEFAVESIRRWWQQLGQTQYGRSRHLLITADCGGSNGYRNRLWKLKLQEFADETGLTLHVCHFPPGTSKWNKIEHRLFCQITTNWRGQPLTSLETVINLISNTTTGTGLEVHAQLDDNLYPTGIQVTDEQFNAIAIERCRFHGEWNYRIVPRKTA
ncbi:ISAzo13 family transposase [Leptolyngbya sp. FACHB-8]|uniref:ISAzo13 family transposase n=1 Tax=unclassified Leptolyngbya TaxID=2650499 RepID=UPI001682FA77|nr:ISAzo13 family transposase [Leptolyngbya sp. FACHB-8]MBD1913840.1 ISAzo13 family transposase [Leptolyngbya sp. FACHB-8]